MQKFPGNPWQEEGRRMCKEKELSRQKKIPLSFRSDQRNGNI